MNITNFSYILEYYRDGHEIDFPCETFEDAVRLTKLIIKSDLMNNEIDFNMFDLFDVSTGESWESEEYETFEEFIGDINLGE